MSDSSYSYQIGSVVGIFGFFALVVFVLSTSLNAGEPDRFRCEFRSTAGRTVVSTGQTMALAQERAMRRCTAGKVDCAFVGCRQQ